MGIQIWGVLTPHVAYSGQLQLYGCFGANTDVNLKGNFTKFGLTVEGPMSLEAILKQTGVIPLPL